MFFVYVSLTDWLGFDGTENSRYMYVATYWQTPLWNFSTQVPYYFQKGKNHVLQLIRSGNLN